jgi:hypothetical protein
MRANEHHHQQDPRKRRRMTVVVMFLGVLLCVLFAPTRRFSNWLNAQEGSGEVADGANASDVHDPNSPTAFDSSAGGSQDADGQGGANAISPFDGPSTGADRLFGLEDASDADGGYAGFGGLLTGTPLLSDLSFGSTPDVGALNVGAGFGGGLSGGGLGGGQAGGGTLGALSSGGWGSVGNGSTGPGWGGNGGGSGSAGNGGSESGGNGGGSGASGNGNGHGNDNGNDGSASSDQGNAPGSGGHGNSGGGNDDGLVFVADGGDHGATDHDDVNASVYPTGPDGSTILSDPDADTPGTGSSSGLSVTAISEPTPVQEPATLLLLGSGFVGLSYRFRRRS